MTPSGQAAIVDQLFPPLGLLADNAPDSERRNALLGAMRSARGWRVATDRIDVGEAALAARGGFLVDIKLDDALEADVLAYYLFGSMILDRVAAYATGTSLGSAWKKWLRELDDLPPGPTRDTARQLDIDLRVTRDKLVAHAGLDAKFSWGVSGAGLTSFAALRFPLQAVPPQQWNELRAALVRVGDPEGYGTNPEDTLTLLHVLRSQAQRLDERGRNAYRGVAEVFGLEAAPISTVTRQMVELIRSL